MNFFNDVFYPFCLGVTLCGILLWFSIDECVNQVEVDKFVDECIEGGKDYKTCEYLSKKVCKK